MREKKCKVGSQGPAESQANLGAKERELSLGKRGEQ